MLACRCASGHPRAIVNEWVPRTAHPGYTEPDFFGVTMYWSHHATLWYAERLQEMEFEILHLGVVGHGVRDIAGLRPERHPVVLARRS